MTPAAKVDSSKWKKQIDQLTPQLRAAAGKVILKYGDMAKARLERDLANNTGGYKNTIKSGNSSNGKTFYYWISIGDDENPAGAYEWGHIDKKSGKHVKPAKVFYPVVKVTNKAKNAALRSAYNRILKTIFK